MSDNERMSIISKTILGVSIGLVSLILFAMGLTACNSQPTQIELIGEERAKEIAISHAGVSADGTEYDYEIDAQTGEIIQFDKDTEKY